MSALPVPSRRPGGRRVLALLACAPLLAAACATSSPAADHMAKDASRPPAAASFSPGPTGASSSSGLAATTDGPSSPAVASSGNASTAPASPSGPAGGPATSDPSTAQGPTAAAPSAAPSDLFPNGLLIADRGAGRILAVRGNGSVFWQFPVRGSLPRGQRFSADDAFVAPDGQTIVANDESHQVIDRIDIRTRQVVWQYGHYGVPGSGGGYLHTPDDAYPLANGDIVVADIMNCRVLEIAPDKSILRTWGRTGRCRDAAPRTYGKPNGDTPLPDGGLLLTEITGSRVVRLSPDGTVVFDVHVPVAYPSDAQLEPDGTIVVVDFSNPGAVVAVSPKGRLLWRYAPASGRGRLDHPSLGTPLPNGDIVINDDFRDRIVVLDPRVMRLVWQYGRTDVASTRGGYLADPDGNQPIPPGAAF